MAGKGERLVVVLDAPELGVLELEDIG